MNETNVIHIGEENNENGNMPLSFSSSINEKNIPTVTTAIDVIALNRKNSSSSSRITNITDRSASLISIKSGIGLPSKISSAASVSSDSHSINQCNELLMKQTEQHKLSTVQKFSNENDKPKDRGRVDDNENGKLKDYRRSEDNVSSRSCFSEEAVVSVLKEMENELRKCRNRCEQLEKIVHLQQQDIESLRFQIRWKDSRIDFLQGQLQQLDVTRNISRSS